MPYLPSLDDFRMIRADELDELIGVTAIRRRLRGEQWTVHDALIESARRSERQSTQERMIQHAIALDRQQQGQRAALRQHDQKRQWYEAAIVQACQEWLQGSLLRHDQMATKLLESAPAEGVSRQSLTKQLATLLREIDKPRLIRGLKK